MRTVLLMDKETIKNGGNWPYRFNNVVYFGIDSDNVYIVVTSNNVVHRVPVDTIDCVRESVDEEGLQC